VKHVQGQLKCAQRMVCRVLSQHRSTQRYTPQIACDESRLMKRMDSFVQLHPRRGYRMMWGTLRLEGWRINKKRVHRLCQREGFCVPQKQRKKCGLERMRTELIAPKRVIAMMCGVGISCTIATNAHVH